MTFPEKVKHVRQKLYLSPLQYLKVARGKIGGTGGGAIFAIAPNVFFIQSVQHY